MPVSPVVAYAVGMTPAATVSGATPARTKNSTAGTPSRSRASARDTLPGLLAAAWVLDIMALLFNKGRMGLGVSYAVREQGAVHGGLGLGDHLAQGGIKLARRLIEAAAGFRRQVQRQPRAQPAGSGQPGQGRALGIHRAGRVQLGLHPGDRRERAVGVRRNPPLAAPGLPRGRLSQVSGLLQLAGHVCWCGASQERQLVPCRVRLVLAE